MVYSPEVGEVGGGRREERESLEEYSSDYYVLQQLQANQAASQPQHARQISFCTWALVYTYEHSCVSLHIASIFHWHISGLGPSLLGPMQPDCAKSTSTTSLRPFINRYHPQVWTNTQHTTAQLHAAPDHCQATRMCLKALIS